MSNLELNQNNTKAEKSCLEIVLKLKTAVEFECKHQYINAIGKAGDFASFVRSEAKAALNIFEHSNKWQEIVNLINRYALLDLGSRMHICKRIFGVLQELEDFYNTEIETKDLKRYGSFQTHDEIDPKLAELIDPELNLAEFDVRFVQGVGLKTADKLKKLGIKSCEELLNYLPRTHISYSDVTPIRNLEIGTDATIMGYITKISTFTIPHSGLVILSIFIKDNSGTIKVNKFFKGNSANYYIKQYQSQYPSGSYVMCVGQVKEDRYSRQRTLTNTVLEIISEDFSESDRSEHAHLAKIVPIYPLTEGLSLMTLRKLIHKTLNLYRANLQEFIPEKVLEDYKLMGYAQAIEEIHFPSSLESKDAAAKRLLFNDFFLMQVKFMQLRHHYKNRENGIKFNCFENGLVDKFIDSLPFKLTEAQERVFFREILPDMVSPQPMHRLLQGDVGSGKTIVAFLAALVAISDGYQVAIMVPTEILAEQHYNKFVSWVNAMEESLKIKVAILIGKQRVKQRREVLEGLKNGSINLVVGTHALIQESVEFKNLGLAVIDEQHRFGVEQRELLANKASNKGTDLQLQIVHTEEELDRLANSSMTSIEKLFMTATPIPRTLALATYGDLDMSEIDQMPVGRLPIITKIADYKKDAYQLISDEVLKGHQAYIVFPLIEESETLSAKAATVEYERLKETIFKDFRMGLIHGKLKDEEKEQVMNAFRLGEINILVSTTVIEVGVDVPNATVMMIESAERFGLAQLHQLRGRVGRSDLQSYCLLSSNASGQAIRERLGILTKTNNGFLIAQADMKIRGTGDLIGLKQSGMAESSLQALVDQEELLISARNAAQQLIDTNPELDEQEALQARLKNHGYMMHVNAG